MFRFRPSCSVACVLLLSLCGGSSSALAQNPLTAGDVRAQHALDAAKKAGSGELYALLKTMPKGGELHMHLSGAVYAETFIAEAVKAGLCVGPVDPGKPPVPEGQAALTLVRPTSKDCPAGAVPVADAMKNQKLYDSMIDSFSMRAFVPTEGINGHDQFFATFDRFGGVHDAVTEWLEEVATRAAAQNEQYLEIMQTPTFSHAAAIAYRIGWPDIGDSNYKTELPKLRDALLSAGLRDEVPIDSKQLDDAKNNMKLIVGARPCSDEGAGTTNYPHTICDVRIHWLYQVLRGFPPQQVFAQTLLGFEVASADPDVVGINFVMPEDGRISMQDYHLQMLMLDYLHSVYPKVHITLHAGEVASGMVPPAGLSFHIREAVELGHAERIGHGVDVLYEDHPEELLKEMAAKHVAVEINLTSNDVILGIKGSDHPLAAYRAAHVPFALSTDDEGVSRIDLTHEYVRAVEEQGLRYVDLKASARNAIEHSFLHGESLWATRDVYTRRVAACSAAIAPQSKPSASCRTFLDANEKAAVEYELERRFASWEAEVR